VLARPTFAALESPGVTLAPEQLSRALAALSRAGVTYVVFGGASGLFDAYDAVLEIHAGGGWDLRRPVNAAASA